MPKTTQTPAGVAIAAITFPSRNPKPMVSSTEDKGSKSEGQPQAHTIEQDHGQMPDHSAASREVGMRHGFSHDIDPYIYTLSREKRTQISLKQVPITIKRIVDDVAKDNGMSTKGLILLALRELGKSRVDLRGAAELANIPEWDQIRMR